ncbi:hypothetical protein VTL71DRAFT_15568 [Oculimacula yallundae]|uniref:Uncharacterized protein n=1 Tax=Oculimacula yallundae TaxID=86028 RepID=A0ABR4CH00_9HELO
MKLIILSALLIPGTISAAVNNAGLEARATNTCGCYLYMSNGFRLSDNMPNDGKGLLQRNSKVIDASGATKGYCAVSYNRAPNCNDWKQVNGPTGPNCDGKIGRRLLKPFADHDQAASTPAKSTTTVHSQGLGDFLAQFTGDNAGTNVNSNGLLVGILTSELAIKSRRIADNETRGLVEMSDEALGVKDASSMETDIRSADDGQSKEVKKDSCCGCGGCGKT